VALLTFLVCVRNYSNCLRDGLLWSCAAFALAGFLGCFPRPNIAHIAFAAPLACPLLALSMTRLIQWWRPTWWRYRYLVVVVAGVVIGLCALSVLIFLQISQHALRAQILPTPRGGAAFFEPGVDGLLPRIAATPSRDVYFFYPFASMLPFLTAREQVSKYDVFMPGYTLPSQYHDACLSVMQHASWVIIDRRWTDPTFLKRRFPAMRDAQPQETKRFEQVLDAGFELAALEGAFELRRRREGVNDSACAGIAD